ncbi:unknown protein [Seminavis robusta]|uniref:Macro domain-containing protein n=1 Tax=Seminavis robusta TaxID=568900 RepID=A0A9N8E1W7_9STRA|nr:unknown protein [Seminavis robusta]|eukprot:Sro568_g168220.1 n/a (285) ;mRNA; r:52147-53001
MAIDWAPIIYYGLLPLMVVISSLADGWWFLFRGRGKVKITAESAFINLFQEGISTKPLSSSSLLRMATYKLDNHKFITIAVGDTANFKDPFGAIVNACNEGGDCAGGMDSSISDHGSDILEEARRALPPVSHKQGLGSTVKCRTGHAKLLGPNKFGTLSTDYVIIAVGPDYTDVTKQNESKQAEYDRKLRHVYTKSCILAAEAGATKIVFPQISGGLYRGNQKDKHLARQAILGIGAWAGKKEAVSAVLEDIIFCVNSKATAKKIIAVADEEFETKLKSSVAGN